MSLKHRATDNPDTRRKVRRNRTSSTPELPIRRPSQQIHIILFWNGQLPFEHHPKLPDIIDRAILQRFGTKDSIGHKIRFVTHTDVSSTFDDWHIFTSRQIDNPLQWMELFSGEIDPGKIVLITNEPQLQPLIDTWIEQKHCVMIMTQDDIPVFREYGQHIHYVCNMFPAEPLRPVVPFRPSRSSAFGLIKKPVRDQVDQVENIEHCLVFPSLLTEA
jgi:hypothetical protein